MYPSYLLLPKSLHLSILSRILAMKWPRRTWHELPPYPLCLCQKSWPRKWQWNPPSTNCFCHQYDFAFVNQIMSSLQSIQPSSLNHFHRNKLFRLFWLVADTVERSSQGIWILFKGLILDRNLCLHSVLGFANIDIKNVLYRRSHHVSIYLSHEASQKAIVCMISGLRIDSKGTIGYFWCLDNTMKRSWCWSSKRCCWLKATSCMLTCSYLASRMCVAKESIYELPRQMSLKLTSIGVKREE